MSFVGFSQRLCRWSVQKLHLSWQLAWCSAGILVGVALAPQLNPAWFRGMQWLLVAAALLILVTLKQTRIMLIMAVLAGGCIGLWRGGQVQQALLAYEPYLTQEVVVTGRVNEDVVVSAEGEKKLRLAAVAIDEKPLAGEVWVSTETGADIKRGDKVTVSGRLEEGFGNLPGAMYRAKLTNVTRPTPGDVARRVRDWFASGVRRAIQEPEASLGVGYLVGQRSSLPEKLDQQLRLLGLTHIVVASGYNLTILVRLTRRLMARVSKYLATLSASVMMVGFVMITGFSPSMSRAALVTGLSLAAWYYGRTIQPLVLLPLAAAITALLNPGYMWGDIGWYLSFTAFAGVMVLAPLLEQFFWGLHNKPGTLRQILVETASAQMVTLPIIAYTFGQYAPLALPANLLVLPAIPLTMLLTFIAGVSGLILPPLGWVLALPATAVLRYMTYTVDWLASLPIAYGEINFGTQYLAVSYVLITFVLLVLWRKTHHNFAQDNIVA